MATPAASDRKKAERSSLAVLTYHKRIFRIAAVYHAAAQSSANDALGGCVASATAYVQRLSQELIPEVKR